MRLCLAGVVARKLATLSLPCHPPCGSQGWNSSLQAWWQAPLLSGAQRLRAEPPTVQQGCEAVGHVVSQDQ